MRQTVDEKLHNTLEQLQRDYRVTLTGPTTLTAILNSLQMGFRALAIEKRSSEVWQVVGSVKTEFGKFGDVLEKQKRSWKKPPDPLTRPKSGRARLAADLTQWRQYPIPGRVKRMPKLRNSHLKDIQATMIESALFSRHHRLIGVPAC